VRKHHFTLRDKDVQEQAVALLQSHLRLTTPWAPISTFNRRSTPLDCDTP